MRRNILIVISILLIASGVVFYFKYYKSERLSVWSFIPADAIAVYESNDLIENINESSELKIWKNISALPFISTLNEYLTTLDSLGGESGEIENIFSQNQFLVSIHNTSKYSIGTLFSIEIKDVSGHSFVGNILSNFNSNTGINEKTRNYLGHQITELSNSDNVFSYIFYKNFVIGSFTPFLVEDAIRTINDGNFNNFKESHENLFKLNSLEQDQGNIYINGSKIADLVGTFLDPLVADIGSLNTITDHTLLDISVSNDHLLLTGFSLNDLTTDNFLQSYDSLQSVEISMVDVVPENTAALYHFSFNDFGQWHKKIKELWRRKFPSRLTFLGELENRYGLNLSDLYENMGDQLGFMHMAATGTNQSDLVLCMQPSDPNGLINIMNSISNSADQEAEPYREIHAGTTIRQIDITEVPERILGPLFKGFNSTYYMLYSGRIFLGNNEEVLKTLIDNVGTEKTWNKSVKTNNFLDVTNKEANVSLIVNTSKALNLVSSKLNSEWSKTWSENISIFKQLEYIAIQFTNVDNNYYTNIALQHPGPLLEVKKGVEFKLIAEKEIKNDIITQPFAIRNHNDQSLEMLFQDSEFNVFHISNSGDSLWSTAVDGKIISQVSQVDYYKNNKLQYMFATRGSVHIIDRTGTYIPGYPLKLPESDDIKNLSLIDYDNSKKYRVMAATDQGDYFMHDKSGRVLEGWNPKKLEGSPTMDPFHLRVRNRDHIIFLSDRGLVNVLNRRGQSRAGFPVNLNSSVSNSVFVSKGSNDSNTSMSILLDEGVIVQLNLQGNTIKRDHIYKSTTNDKYKLAVSSNDRSYIILRYDENSASILNQDGQEIFQHLHSVSDDMSVKYYNFGNNNEVIVITDRPQEFTYLYDMQGNMLHYEPLNTGHDLAMLYFESENAYRLYTTYKNKLRTLSLSR